MILNRQQKEGGRPLAVLSWLAVLSRWVISLPFLYAGSTKIADPKGFAVVIDGYGLLPGFLVMPTALILPILEIVVATGLLFNVRRCLPVITVMLIFFIAVLGYGIVLGLDVDCGCFGPDDPEQAYHGLWSALIRDFGLLVPVLYLFWFQRRAVRKKAVPSF